MTCSNTVYWERAKKKLSAIVFLYVFCPNKMLAFFSLYSHCLLFRLNSTLFSTASPFNWFTIHCQLKSVFCFLFILFVFRRSRQLLCSSFHWILRNSLSLSLIFFDKNQLWFDECTTMMAKLVDALTKTRRKKNITLRQMENITRILFYFNFNWRKTMIFLLFLSVVCSFTLKWRE